MIQNNLPIDQNTDYQLDYQTMYSYSQNFIISPQIFDDCSTSNNLAVEAPHFVRASAN